MFPASTSNIHTLRAVRRDTLLALNDLRDAAKVSRARIYVWLQQVLSLPKVEVGELSAAQCTQVQEAIQKERASEFASLLAGVKPLHHRNSLAGSVYNATLLFPGDGKGVVSVFLNGHTWDAPVAFLAGTKEAEQAKLPSSSSTAVQIEFRGEQAARIYREGNAVAHVAEVRVGQFWSHG